MAKITLYVPRLVASLEDRTLSGLLLPFGEPGHTNLGRVTASAESKIDVANTVVLNVQHDRNRPVGKAMTVEPLPEGLRAAFHVLSTREGDDALLEASEGLRAGLSVELEPVVIRNGHIVSGTVVATGLVVEPAFPSARLAAADLEPVPDMGDEPPAETPAVVIDGEPLADVETVEVTAEAITITTQDPDEEPLASENPEGTPAMTAAAVATNTALVAAPPKTLNKNALFAALAQFGKTRLLAALTDVVPGDILGIEQPQYVGQLWDGKAYQRKIIPLFAHGDLTSFKVAGWKWGTKPAVALYEGDKAAIPSGAVTTVPADVDAQRIAGGHDIDRKFKDFGSTEFWEAYFAAMTESYARISDAFALSEILAVAPYAAPGAAVDGVATAMTYIVDGAMAILDATDTMPTFAVVSPDLWRGLVLTRSEDALAYLNAALGLEDGSAANFSIKPSAALDDGTVLVGVKDAATIHELPGSPIRVSAENIANGGVDEALFGYVAVNVHDEDGLALVAAADPATTTTTTTAG